MQKRKNSRTREKEQEKGLLKDHLQGDILTKLQEKKKELKAKEEDERRQQLEQRRREREEREKNKSFEELLDESGLDWKEFK
ncbi:DUF3886 domain-containing protein [Bacillus marinisedimentorum]|uniref:DUF3886 domain-containing protein n=1 Tax=Bacillus marinisedimentorum TaxID=1821260 RepID=UPI001FDECD55|nr:DUF3886 domain-containing protein [Bacillus marinisedimentorum]